MLFSLDLRSLHNGANNPKEILILIFMLAYAVMLYIDAIILRKGIG